MKRKLVRRSFDRVISNFYEERVFVNCLKYFVVRRMIDRSFSLFFFEGLETFRFRIDKVRWYILVSALDKVPSRNKFVADK